MWPESSSVNAVNLAKKNYHSSRDIEFFLGDYFFWRALYCRRLRQTLGNWTAGRISCRHSAPTCVLVAECVSERILTIGQYLTQLRQTC